MMDTFITCNLAVFLRWAVGFFMGVALMCFIIGSPGWGAIACILNGICCMAQDLIESMLASPIHKQCEDLLAEARARAHTTKD